MDISNETENKKRTKEIKVRVNKYENEKLIELSKIYGKSKASFLRESALEGFLSHSNGKGKHRPDPAMIRAISRIGNNLNQIAKQINVVAKSGDALNVLDVLDELTKIREATQSVKGVADDS